MAAEHTPGPWPLEQTGDGKRYLVGKGLVEGPNGYEVAEVYADDCPIEVAKANALLIAAAPDMLAALAEVRRHGDFWASLPADIRGSVAAAIAKATGAA